MLYPPEKAREGKTSAGKKLYALTTAEELYQLIQITIKPEAVARCIEIDARSTLNNVPVYFMTRC